MNPTVEVVVAILSLMVNISIGANPVLKMTPSNCSTDSYFDVSSLSCEKCRGDTIQSADGLSCRCKANYRQIFNFGGFEINCTICPPGKVASRDGFDCVSCSNTSSTDTSTCTECPSMQIAPDRDIHGSLIGSPVCFSCVESTFPSADGSRCVKCPAAAHGRSCNCPPPFVLLGGICFKADEVGQDTSSLYQIQYENGVKVDSWFYREHIRAVEALCRLYKNLTACQTLGNLCVLLHYSDQTKEDSCALYRKVSKLGVGSQPESPLQMPSLYYLSSEADLILHKQDIPTEYSFDEKSPFSTIRLTAAVYSIEGHFMGFRSVSDGLLQMCKGNAKLLESAFRFGRRFRQKCEISSRELWKQNLQFYDIYLDYVGENGEKYLYPVPLLNLNYQSGSQKVNRAQQTEGTRWQLTKRLFVVDTVSGVDTVGKVPKVIQYLKYIGISVELQLSRDGKIYPPLIRLEYDEVKVEDMEGNKFVPVEFEVTYRMSTTRHEKDLEIAMGVLCPLGALWAFLRMWSWYQRSGRTSQLDHIALLKFLVYLAASIANVFFVVILGGSLWLLVVYKKQRAVITAYPNPDQEYSFLVYIGLATALKTVEMIHLVIEQVTSHVFFLDWERPRGHIIPRHGEPPEGDRTKTLAPINIWRTYMIANEWNELQICRKTSYVVQLFAMVFFLKILNFEALALIEPDSTMSNVPSEYQDTKMSRFAVAATLYLLIGLVQWFIGVVIVERCITDQFHAFSDLCSVSNISVFVMLHRRFGYYIHGRSVHGHADTDMREMNECLQEESDNLRSQRGLEPNTDNQTFIVLLPVEFRNQYDSILSGLSLNAQQTRMASADPVTVRTESTINVYTRMNQFLSAFIEHNWPRIDYTVKNRSFVECVLDLEMLDVTMSGATLKGFFYNDPSEQAYVSALFYGNEFTLLSFDLLIFCMIDLISHNFLWAAIGTFIVTTIVRKIRQNGGRSNIVRKALVDKRFLI